MNRFTIWCATTLAFAGACAQGEEADDRASHAEQVSSVAQALGDLHAGAVFTQSNETSGNRVFAFVRDADGELHLAGTVETEGTGSGDALGSQGALALSEGHRFLLVVNAGSNDVSAFVVHGTQLTLTDRVASGGARPISVTTRRGLVYVLNAGTPNNVSGFFLDFSGRLHSIPGATRPLSADQVTPAQVELTRDARALIVTEKDTNSIDTFRVSAFGRLDAPIVQASAGITPFGFEFTHRGDHLIVSEAGSGSMSSYAVSRRSGVSLISGPVSNTQAAPCWVVVTNDDRFTYVANAGSESISSYRIDRSGAIELLDARAGEVGEGSAPIDMALDATGRHLFDLDRGNASIVSFTVLRDGSLDPLDVIDGLSPFASGMAAY